MYITITKNSHTKKERVYLVEGYRDKDGKVKHRTLKSYGYLNELEAEDPEILEKLKREAKEATLATKQKLVDLTIDLDAKNSTCSPATNYGYFFLEELYRSLGIESFFKNVQKKSRFTYDINEILKLLTFGRFLQPASKSGTCEQQTSYFREFNTELKDIYRALDVLNNEKENLQMHLHKVITKQYARDCTLVFYDVTNYYFETEVQDELRKKGVSKEHRPQPIVQMGLFIDQNSIPIGYKLFSGNTNDTSTMIPILEEMKDKFSLGRIIVTADKGLNSGNNLGYLSAKKNGYIVSQKIRGTAQSFMKQVLDEEGYISNPMNTFKSKSFIRERTVTYQDEPILLKEKVVCFWSKQFDDREKHKREELRKTIDEMLLHPTKYKSSNSYGIKKYLKAKELDQETGEIKDPNLILEFNQEKYDRDVALDGYYVIISSETEMSDQEIIEKYRGLWRIEESFRILKSDLEGRPVFVRKQEHIEGHFLICFLALVYSRILEHKLNHQYTTAQIQEALNSGTCQLLEKNIYLLGLQNTVYKEIESLYQVHLDQKYATYEMIHQYQKSILKKKNTQNTTK